MVDPMEPEDPCKAGDPHIATSAAAGEANVPGIADENGTTAAVVTQATTTTKEATPAATITPTTTSAAVTTATTTAEPETSGSKENQQPNNAEPAAASVKLHLDLYNFDSPVAEGSRYVLTSPRSLEACARCGVMPLQLLPRPLADFAREAPGRSMRVATGMFEVYEKDRHAKLRQCREERERIIRDEKKRMLQAMLNSKSKAEEEKKAEGGTGKVNCTESQPQPAKTTTNNTLLSSTTPQTSTSTTSTYEKPSVLPPIGSGSGSGSGSGPFGSKSPLSGSGHQLDKTLPSSSSSSSKSFTTCSDQSSKQTSPKIFTPYASKGGLAPLKTSKQQTSSSSRTTESSRTTAEPFVKSSAVSQTSGSSSSSGGRAQQQSSSTLSSSSTSAKKTSGRSTSKTANTFPRSSPKPPTSFPKTASLAAVVSKSAVQSPATAPNGTCGGGGGVPHFLQHNGGHFLRSKTPARSHSLENLQRRRDTYPPCTSTNPSNNTTNTTTTTTCGSSESGASSSYSWDSPRDHWGRGSSPRARTLATFNSLMGRSLSLGDLSHSLQTTQKVERIVKEVRRRGLKAVPERDRKIAALMLARYQEEDIMSQTRYVAHLQWDSEKRLDELRREREERDKQRAVLQCQRAWQSQVSTRQRRLSQQERQTAAAKLRQAEESEERWREQAEQQERSRLQRLQQAAREEKHKKALQEQNLRALEEERAAMLEQEQLILKEKLTIAELKRQEREHEVQEERRGLNRAERRRHAAIIQEIARREEEEREEARRQAEEKLSRSLENYEQMVERRERELKEKAKREEKQIQRARRVAEQKERQQKQQLAARVRETEKRAQQAAAVAEERMKEKAQRAVQTRQEKERLQRLNRQRVEEEEKQRRLELLQSIERKLEKSEQIFKEKKAILESARSVARASFHVRDKVREETNMRTFDKMALEAQLKASLDEKCDK